jgi:hypothetical protein
MTLEEYNEWILMLKTVEIRKGNQNLFEIVFKFSPEKFIRENGLDESFIKEFQKDRKIIHNRLIDHEKITKLKKRKVVPEVFIYGGKRHESRVCVCVKRFKNEEHRAKGGYDFYETIHYNYAIMYDSFFDRDDVILFDAKGSKVYSTINEFNKHFIDIREHKINSILK